MQRMLGIVSFIICVLADSSFASTYYVAKTGGGSTCSQASPCLTIQAGVNRATSPGDIVNVAVGTYTETVSTWPASGTAGNPITVQANPGDTVTWTGPNGASSGTGAIYIQDRNYIRIQGFRFANSAGFRTIEVLHSAALNKSTPTVGIEIMNNTFVSNGSDGSAAPEMSRQIHLEYIGMAASYSGATVNTVSGNTFTNNWGANIDMYASSDVLIENNTSTGNKGSLNPSNGNLYQTNFVQGFNTGPLVDQRNIVRNNNISSMIQVGSQGTEAVGIRMDVGAQKWTVNSNTIHDLGAEGPGWNGGRHFYGIYCEANCNNMLMYDNLIYKTNEGCIGIGNYQVSTAHQVQLYNNTLYNCGQVGVYLDNLQNGTVKNNIISGNSLSLITVTPSTISLGGLVLSNNLWFKTGTTLFGLWNYDPNTQGWGTGNLNLANWNAASTETGSVGSDPLFVNPSSGDFRLQSNSPAIDRGATLSEVTTDLLGVTRPQGCCYEIGAYELGGTMTPPSPASLVIPGRIEAENYNTGGQNVGYFDTTVGNLGGACKTDDVDIKDVPGEGCTIAYTEAGEWLAYSVNVTSSGAYSTSLRIANGSGSFQTIHLEVDGQDITGPVSIPSSGSYSTQVTVTGPTLNLTQGTHILKLYFDTGLVDINWMEFQAQPSSIPSAPSVAQVSTS